MSFLSIPSTDEESEKDDGYPIEFIVENDSDNQSSDELLRQEDDSQTNISSKNNRTSKHFRQGMYSNVNKRMRNINTSNETNIQDDEESDCIYNKHKYMGRNKNLSEIIYNEDNKSDCSIHVKRKRIEPINYDIMFLKSLAPYFKQLEPTRKLVMRNRIQDLLLKEIADQDSCERTVLGS